MTVKIAILALFILVTVGVGIYSRRRVHNINDFFLGGRNMGPWITAFAYGTSYFSAVVFVGYAGKFGWGFGLSATWIGIGNAVIGCLLAWLLMAKKTRIMTHKLNASTMPEFFAARYDSVGMKIVSAVVIFVFLVPYTASIYKGLGYMFESAFGLPMNTIILIMTALTGLYLILGGYVATALNDLIQGIIMIGGSIMMVVYILTHPDVGGLSQGIARLSSIESSLGSAFGPAPLNLGAVVLLTSLGTWGLPQMLHKFYAVKDERAIKRGTLISTLFALVIGGSAYFAGSFGRVMLDNQMPNNNVDMIVPVMLEKALPDVLMSVIIVLMLSASMSTLSSLVLVSSSVISIDLVKGFIKPKIDDRKNMLLMRFFCLIFVVMSYFMAIWQNPTIVALMALSWGVISGMFIAPYLYGLLWKGTTRIGAWSGFFTGFAAMAFGLAVELPKVGFDIGKVFMPGIGAISMLASLVVVPVVSLVTKKYSKAHISKVFDTERTAA
ncbi:MAG TPA: sodium:solute symporter [Thermoclostridium sp.]|nr:sodium:solute symporter [Thermoclostridium sp.]HPU45914.1 sodium:solute symporter [Thermoclostridium sp.]